MSRLNITSEDRARWRAAILEHSPLPPDSWMDDFIERKELHIPVENSGQYFAACDRASSGQIIIHSIERGNNTNRLLYTLRVSYPAPQQSNLFDL